MVGNIWSTKIRTKLPIHGPGSHRERSKFKSFIFILILSLDGELSLAWCKLVPWERVIESNRGCCDINSNCNIGCLQWQQHFYCCCCHSCWCYCVVDVGAAPVSLDANSGSPATQPWSPHHLASITINLDAAIRTNLSAYVLLGRNQMGNIQFVEAWKLETTNPKFAEAFGII